MPWPHIEHDPPSNESDATPARESKTPPGGLPPTGEENSRLDEVIGEYLEALEAGHAPSRESLLAGHPDLAGELAQFLDDQDRFAALVAPLTVRLSGTPQSGLPGGESQTGRSFGNYQILEEIARGGMGVVYKARQFVGQGTPRPSRVVALKMVSQGSFASPTDIQRFRLEAAAVARLDHPNIVPLYEAGEHDPGSGAVLPYFSMRLVEGGSLAQNILSFRGKPRQAARLILAVARAVEYAHQRGVLHRDLKPANILLDGPPQAPLDTWRPLVADFGLAKQVQGAESSGFPSGLAATQPGTAVGTPSYMPPEQALGVAPLTTAADVYSLGAILYELLAGRPPFRTPTGLGTLLEALDREPDPPSRFGPNVDRDLDTICLKCLQKEPERRYPTTGALADDLERYLAGKPLLARPIGPLGRAARWCRRRPLLAGLMAAVVLSVLGGISLVFWQWRRAETHLADSRAQKLEAERQRDRAKALFREARAQKHEAERQRGLADESFREAYEVVDTFCIRLSEDRLSQLPGLQPLRKELLQGGLVYLQRLARRQADGPGKPERAGLREELARTYFRIGTIANVIGPKKEALDAYQKAIDLYRKLLEGDPKNREWRQLIASALVNRGTLQHDLGRPEETRESLWQAREICESLLREKVDDRSRDGLASVLGNLALLHHGEGESEKALELNREAGKIRADLVRQHPDQSDYEINLTRTRYNEGNMLAGLGRNDQALACFEDVRSRQERLAQKHPEDLWLQASLAHTYDRVAGFYAGKGKDVEAVALLEMGCRILESLIAANPQVTDFRRDLATLLNNLGGVHVRAGRRQPALKAYERAAGVQRSLVAGHPDVHEYRLNLARTCHNVALRHHEAGRYQEALKAYAESAAHFGKLLKTRPGDPVYAAGVAGALNNSADVLQKMNRPEEAIKTFEKALEHQKMAFARGPHSAEHRRFLGKVYGNLARAYRLARQPAAAVPLSLERRKLWPGNPTELYRIVRDFLLAAQLAEKDSADQRRYQDLALETIRLAVEAGYRDEKELRSNPELAVLRNRPEFERLLRTIRTPSP
jgi:eukaryotic-like serine/threonine-protein kinase